MLRNIIVILLFLTSCKFAEPESYVFQKGYIGNAFIITNIKTEGKKEYNPFGSRLYKFSNSGILLSSFGENYGVINKAFFHKSKSNVIEEIDGVDFQNNTKSLDPGKVYAFYGKDLTVTFPKSKVTIGVHIITICKPKDLAYFENDLFAKRIWNCISPTDLSYKRLLEIKRHPAGCSIIP
jgi:hypothetical protein